MNKFNIEIGKKIRIIRKRRKYSQKKLGEILGITFQQIQKYEKGTNKISFENLLTICREFNIAINYFIEEN